MFDEVVTKNVKKLGKRSKKGIVEKIYFSIFTNNEKKITEWVKKFVIVPVAIRLHKYNGSYGLVLSGNRSRRRRRREEEDELRKFSLLYQLLQVYWRTLPVAIDVSPYT